MIMSCIDVSHLSKKYGSITAVDELKFSVTTGEVFGFLGPNGAGKSTTIKLLTTLIPPSSGSLNILGEDANWDVWRYGDVIAHFLTISLHHHILKTKGSFNPVHIIQFFPGESFNGHPFPLSRAIDQFYFFHFRGTSHVAICRSI